LSITVCSGLLWLFGVFFASIWKLGLIFLSLWRMTLEFWWDCIEYADCFGHSAILTILTLPSHEQGRSLISFLQYCILFIVEVLCLFNGRLLAILFIFMGTCYKWDCFLVSFSAYLFLVHWKAINFFTLILSPLC
jgi:hypothetical protein